jgi:cobalt/nickel transport protein
MEMKRSYWYALGILAIAALCVTSLAMANGDFGGSDDAGGDLISDIDPGYVPWWNGIFGDYEIPGETESLLFALQAAIGAIIIGFIIGRYSKGGQ